MHWYLNARSEAEWETETNVEWNSDRGKQRMGQRQTKTNKE